MDCKPLLVLAALLPLVGLVGASSGDDSMAHECGGCVGVLAGSVFQAYITVSDLTCWKCSNYLSGSLLASHAELQAYLLPGLPGCCLSTLELSFTL